MGLIVDLFAGGGGASLGIKWALGRDPDIAINHDPVAVAVHAANHPATSHFVQDVWRIPPLFVTGGRPVELLWASPDCRHFSKAKGGRPRSPRIRDLAWVVVEWARLVKPNIIFLENVEEFRDWGPLTPDGKPDPDRMGETFMCWVRSLRALGYRVRWRELRACDYGAPTIRKRLFLIARRDDLPITWPRPTHGPEKSGLLPHRTAAECIDWSLPSPSIFLTREKAQELRRRTGISCKRPLAEATLRRIAEGIRRYVIEAEHPFVVRDRAAYIQHMQQAGVAGNMPADEPLRTITAHPKGGGMALVAAFLAKHYTGVVGSDPRLPIGTVTAVDHHGLVAAHLIRHFGRSVGQAPDRPAPTVTAGGGGKTGLITSHLVKLRGTCRHGQDVRHPLATVTAGGNHLAEVRAFLVKYYGSAVGQDLKEPTHTVTARHRLGLVTVTIQDEPYVITDIGMRMLQPKELFLAQGFPANYIIDRGADGRRISKRDQVRLCGNSVCPQVASALVQANATSRAREAA